MFRTIGLGVAVCAMLGHHGVAEGSKEFPTAAKKELKALEGKWKAVRFLHPDRETTPGNDGDNVIVAFKGHAIDFDGVAAGEAFELDPATDPKCLDFKVLRGSGALKEGSTYESIYKLNGDRLIWAMHTGREKNRPATFDKPTVAGTMVIVLERVKE